MMMQGCVSESSHIRVMLFASAKVKHLLLFPLLSVLSTGMPLNKNVSLDIVLKGYPTKQTRSPLCTVNGWAYALSPAAAILKENFAFKTNTAKIAKLVGCLEDNFRKRKSESCRI